MIATNPLRTLTQAEASPDSFHDCNVRGMSWSAHRYEFELDIDYIHEWLLPADAGGYYRFMLSRSGLVFANVSDIKLDLDWARCAMVCQISTMRIVDTRPTPTGMVESNYVLDLSEPKGSISILSTGYRVELYTEPSISDLSRLP